jgi:hypothetical protein
MRVTVALVLVCAAVIIAPASATQSGGNTTTVVPVSKSCNPDAEHQGLHRRTAKGNWRADKPLAGTSYSCLARSHIRKHVTGFRRWQSYREVAPYAGCSNGGKWLRWTAIPGSVVFRESRCSWSAYNPSGACGPYQLLGWTSCATSSVSDKLRHHRMAAYVLKVQGPGAWVAW